MALETQNTKRPHHLAPALVCADCGQTLPFDQYEYRYLETWLHAGCQFCGGQYEFWSIRKLYEREGVQWCEAAKWSRRTADCPLSWCGAAGCPASSESAVKEVA